MVNRAIGFCRKDLSAVLLPAGFSGVSLAAACRVAATP